MPCPRGVYNYYSLHSHNSQVTSRVPFKTPTCPTTRDKPLHSPQGFVFYMRDKTQGHSTDVLSRPGHVPSGAVSAGTILAVQNSLKYFQFTTRHLLGTY